MPTSSKDSLIAVRDPVGIRPLVVGKLNDSYVFSSESCGLDIIGAELVRDVEPGEIIIVKNNKIVTSINDITVKCELERQVSDG